MPTKVFKTQEGAADSVELVGVGLLGAGGRGGIPVEDAARSMPELQKKNEDGSPDLDSDGAPKPLTGKALSEAADEFAAIRGLRVVSVAESKAESAALRAEMGALPERPPANEVAEQDFVETYGSTATVTNEPTGPVVEGADSGVDIPEAPAPAADTEGNS